MSARYRFREVHTTTDDGGETLEKSSVFQGSRVVHRTSATIEARTIEIRDSKATGIYTTYAKGRAAASHRSEVSKSSNVIPRKD
jgi:lipopolysaccharide export system protein LptA